MTSPAQTAPDIAPTTAQAPIVARCSPALRIKAARKHVEKQQRRIERAVAGGDMRQARYLSDCLMRSYDAKIVAVVAAGKLLKRKGRRAPEGQEILDLAGRISAVQSPSEMITVKAKDKKRWPEFRPIHIFGAADLARQHLVRMAKKALLPVTAEQFGSQNGGRKAAVQRVADAMATGDYKLVVTCDLKDFFPSIDRDRLRRDLPMGQKVTTSTLLVADDPTRFKYTGHGIYKHSFSATFTQVASQRGLPQGSCSSPMIADWIVGQVLSGIRLPAGTHLTNYADNFVIMGRTRADVEQALSTLRDAYGRHHAGDLQLIDDGVGRVCDGFEFLGYKIRRRRGRLSITPTRANFAKIEHRAFTLIAKIYHGHRDAVAKLKSSLRAWQNSFSSWIRAGAFVWRLAEDYARDLRSIARLLRSTVTSQLKEMLKSIDALEAAI